MQTNTNLDAEQEQDGDKEYSRQQVDKRDPSRSPLNLQSEIPMAECHLRKGPEGVQGLRCFQKLDWDCL